ncbi:hypothetical protein BT96DRAFT_934824 [Gymnopus androsaceus JB14]|uniref:Uncharacterized protein n=1 Tax=Gymnopus androsaceus JB14 TaxID=1447944 RepID=A0A6A4I871_9AGAR|nr:hypothetical protein BT96DRAFT_934824 [Gymnopus androsaceus JB14]
MVSCARIIGEIKRLVEKDKAPDEVFRQILEARLWNQGPIIHTAAQWVPCCEVSEFITMQNLRLHEIPIQASRRRATKTPFKVKIGTGTLTPLLLPQVLVKDGVFNVRFPRMNKPPRRKTFRVETKFIQMIAVRGTSEVSCKNQLALESAAHAQAWNACAPI